LDKYCFAPEQLREMYKWRWKYIVRKAKREFFTKLLMEKANEGITGMWKVATLCKGRPLKGVGALRTSNGSYATKPEQKAEVLQDTFFPSTPPTVQLSQDFDPPQRPARSWVEFTAVELAEALSGMSNTSAAGTSGIGYQLIKWAHESCLSTIQDLMNACVCRSNHPQVWREASIVVILKPRKADMAAAKSYWPIALLETWSKWLEKLIASRIHKDIGVLDLVPHLQ
jgi:hypothetical protein